jgi:4'-phosphopantetheinyl transferase
MAVAPDAAPGDLALPAGTIRCWRVDLRQPESVVAALATVLSADEAARAARFVFPRDRRRFVVTRASLRVLLGRCRGVSPAAIRFSYGPNGKPALATDRAAPPVHFSVSHSEDLALVGLFAAGPVGIDVEALRSLPDLGDIARRFFAPAEAQAIAALPAAQHPLAFFLCWTRKEAFSKAQGHGLSVPLDRYRVSCRPGEPARLLDVDGSPSEAARWSVFDLRPAPGFVGAMAVRDRPVPPTVLELDLQRDVLPFLVTEPSAGNLGPP